jgi:RNA polymerase sigma-70 factor (ECF subfamily)
MSSAATLEAFVPTLRRYALTLLRDRREADNLVRDCLERALDQLHTKRDDDDAHTWLLAIMHNLFIGRMRRKCVCGQFVPSNYRGSSADKHGDTENNDALRALYSLPEEPRSVVFLVSVEDLTYGAVAQVLGISLGAVMSHLARGRERLRQIMDGKASQDVMTTLGPSMMAQELRCLDNPTERDHRE